MLTFAYTSPATGSRESESEDDVTQEVVGQSASVVDPANSQAAAALVEGGLQAEATVSLAVAKWG